MPQPLSSDLRSLFREQDPDQNHRLRTALPGGRIVLSDEGNGNITSDRCLAVTAPFGRNWPGLAQSGHLCCDADHLANEYTAGLLARRPWLRLGLIAAPSGAAALTAAGWQGPLSYVNDTAVFSAVLRDWKRRFGARVVCAGFSTVELSVAAPPADRDAALAVAAEPSAPRTYGKGPETSPRTRSS